MVDIKKIKIEMVKADETQKDLAEAIGVTRVYISYLFTGKKKVNSLDLLSKIAEHYNKPVSFFLE